MDSLHEQMRRNQYEIVTPSKDVYCLAGGMTLDRQLMKRRNMEDFMGAELRYLGYGVWPHTDQYEAIDFSIREYHLIRAHRGLKYYGHYNVDELREMVVGRRGPVFESSTRSVRAKYIEWLEDADEQPTFPRFMELPAELRELVYQHHFASYPEVLSSPCQPPISMVSKQIRRESLPLFYSECQFAIEHSLYIGIQGVERMPSSELFLRRTASMYIARIRRLVLRVSHPNYPGDEERVQLLIQLEIDPSDGRISVLKVAAGRDGAFKGVAPTWVPHCAQQIQHLLQRFTAKAQPSGEHALCKQALDSVPNEIHNMIGRFPYPLILQWRRFCRF